MGLLLHWKASGLFIRHNLHISVASPEQAVRGLVQPIVFTWDNFYKTQTDICELRKESFCLAPARYLLQLWWPTHLRKKFLPRFRLVRADWSFVAASPREQRLFG